MKKYQDFVPKSDAERLIWCQMYLNNLQEAIQETDTNTSEVEIAELEQEIQELIDAIIDSERQKVAAKAAVAHKEALERKTISKMRRMAARIKACGSRKENVITRMGIKCKSYDIDITELQPTIKAVAAGSNVYIYFNKNHLFNVAVFCRLPGEAFVHIGNGLTSPYVDSRPLTINLQPERREYQLMYTNFKDNFGHPSSIASVVYGG
jgi:hypothetical protein